VQASETTRVQDDDLSTSEVAIAARDQIRGLTVAGGGIMESVVVEDGGCTVTVDVGDVLLGRGIGGILACA